MLRRVYIEGNDRIDRLELLQRIVTYQLVRNLPSDESLLTLTATVDQVDLLAWQSLESIHLLNACFVLQLKKFLETQHLDLVIYFIDTATAS